MIVELFYIKKSRSPNRLFLVFLCDFLKISFCATDLVFAFQVTYIYIYKYIYMFCFFLQNIDVLIGSFYLVDGVHRN